MLNCCVLSKRMELNLDSVDLDSLSTPDTCLNGNRIGGLLAYSLFTMRDLEMGITLDTLVVCLLRNTESSMQLSRKLVLFSQFHLQSMSLVVIGASVHCILCWLSLIHAVTKDIFHSLTTARYV